MNSRHFLLSPRAMESGEQMTCHLILAAEAFVTNATSVQQAIFSTLRGNSLFSKWEMTLNYIIKMDHLNVV